MSLTEINIRPAIQSDAPFIAEMIKLSMGRLGDHLFDADGLSITRYIEDLVRNNAGRFGLRFSFVAESAGTLRGMLLSYTGRSLGLLNVSTGPHLFSAMGFGPALRFMKRGASLPGGREALKDEYYISNLGVDPFAQGLGVGSALLNFAENLARNEKLAKCSLIVGLYNKSALRLYERLGYQIAETVQHENEALGYHRMLKQLP